MAQKKWWQKKPTNQNVKSKPIRLVKNRFAGADNVYSTKKFLVREDISSGSNGRILCSKKYIAKNNRSLREFADIFGVSEINRLEKSRSQRLKGKRKIIC